MTFLSRKSDYALLILYFLSKRQSGASSREISDAFKLGRPFLANILKNLCQAGLVVSQRGVNGGYTIARPPQEIRLTEVLDALTESFKLNECNHQGAEGYQDPVSNSCAVMGLCPIRQGMESLHSRILTMLSGVYLSELFAPAPGLRLIDLNLDSLRNQTKRPEPVEIH